MKMKISMLIACIFLLSGINVVSISDDLKSDIQTKTYEFKNISFIEESEKIKITLEGANSCLLQAGKPILPSYNEIFTFPTNTKIKNVICRPKNLQKSILPKPISYSPFPVLIQTGIPVKKEENTEVLNIYPEKWYKTTIGHGLYNNIQSVITKIEIYPVKYNQFDNSITWINEVDIEIHYDLPVTNTMYDAQYDLLIISPAEYANVLHDLVLHKNNRGVSTKHVWLNEIYNGDYFAIQGRDNPEKIKYFIKNAYDMWGIRNVLLVGDIDKLPSRETHILVSDSDNEVFVSDIYYADLYNKSKQFSTWDSNNNNIFAEYDWNGETDEIDLYPDVKIGRLPCVNSEQVSIIVNKIITYENTKAFAQDWFTNLVVIGGDTAPNDDRGIDEGEFVNQAIIDRLDGFNVDKIWYSNNRLNGVGPTGVQNINNGINNGCGFVDFSGHGAPHVWKTYPHNGSRQNLPTPSGSYTNSIIQGLKNKEKLPIVLCGGCSLGKFSANKNCFAWSFLSNPYGGGIASFGSTGLGYIYIGKYVINGLIEGLNVKIIEAYSNGANTFGDIWLHAVNKYLNTIYLDAGDYKTIEEWHPFGDPTLTIAAESQKPLTPSAPDGPSRGKVGVEYVYNVSTTDPEGDLIYYFFDWGDNENSDWIGPYESGDICSASYIWTNKGTYQIRVKARDEHGSITGWSEPLTIKMPKNNRLTILEKHVFNHPVLDILLRIYKAS